MRWFEEHWKEHPQWIAATKAVVVELFNDYKRRHPDEVLASQLRSPHSEHMSEFDRYNTLDDRHVDPLQWWEVYHSESDNEVSPEPVFRSVQNSPDAMNNQDPLPFPQQQGGFANIGMEQMLEFMRVAVAAVVAAAAGAAPAPAPAPAVQRSAKGPDTPNERYPVPRHLAFDTLAAPASTSGEMIRSSYGSGGRRARRAGGGECFQRV